MSANRWVFGLALVLLTAGLSGCLGIGGDGGADGTGAGSGALENASAGSTGAGASTDGAAGEANLTELAHGGIDEATREHFTWNDSFSPEQNCYAGGCLTGSALQQYEVPTSVTDGVPFQIRAQLTYDEGPTIFGQPVGFGMYAEDGDFYNFEYDSADDGTVTITSAVRLSGSPLMLSVFYNWPTGTEPEVSYTVTADIVADPSVAPAGVPVEVDLEPGDRLVATPTAASSPGSGPGGEAGGGSGASLLVYGPGDTLLERASSNDGALELTVPQSAGSAGGSNGYVLVAPEDGPDVRLSTNGSAAQMRALGITGTGGDPHPVRGQPVDWTFETSTVPLRVGVYMTEDTPASASVDDGTVALSGPSGTLLSGDFGCGLCISLGYGSGWATPIGADGLSTGTYEVTYEPTAEAGFEVGHFVVTYER